MTDRIAYHARAVRVYEEWICSKCDETCYTERVENNSPLNHRHCEQCGFTEYLDSTEPF